MQFPPEILLDMLKIIFQLYDELHVFTQADFMQERMNFIEKKVLLISKKQFTTEISKYSSNI